MPSVTLQACHPVMIYSTLDDPPPEVDVDLDAGGSVGGGLVQIKTSEDGPPVCACPCGTHRTFPVASPKEIWLHYQKSGSGADEIECGYDVIVN